MTIQGLMGNVQHSSNIINTRNVATDLTKALGLNMIIFTSIPHEIDNVKAGISLDQLKTAIIYAKQKGIKVFLRMSPAFYSNYNFNAFPTMPDAVAEFKSDLAWNLSNYKGDSQIDGLMFEEPQYHDNINHGQAGMDWYINFFSACKNIVTAANLPTGFNYGFNTGNNTVSGGNAQGLDFARINSMRLFTYITPQIATGNLETFKNTYNNWKLIMPNLEIFPCTYITSKIRTDLPRCKPPNTTDSPVCWNEGFFEELRYVYQNNIPFNIFREEYMELSPGVPKAYWPNETWPPGIINVGQHVQHILAHPLNCLEPVCDFNIEVLA